MDFGRSDHDAKPDGGPEKPEDAAHYDPDDVDFGQPPHGYSDELDHPALTAPSDIDGDLLDWEVAEELETLSDSDDSPETDVPPPGGEHDWDPRRPLEWLIPQLDRVEHRAALLADSARHREHSTAARDVLEALRVGAWGLLDFRHQMPTVVDQPIHDISEMFLYDLGANLDRAIETEGLTWPPPREHPPPSVTIDLVAMYRYGSGQAFAPAEDPWLLLAPKLEAVATLCRQLLDNWSDADVERVQRIAGDDGERRSRVGTFLSGTALAIGLIQGPGAVNDLPGDVRELSAGVGSVVSTVISGISRVADDLTREIRR